MAQNRPDQSADVLSQIITRLDEVWGRLHMSESEFERGKVQGRNENRLDDHDDHFAKLNGSVEKLGGKVEGLTLAIQRLIDQGTANAATVLTTASALKDAEAARRDKSEQAWSPFAKTITVVGVCIAALGLYLALR